MLKRFLLALVFLAAAPVHPARAQAPCDCTPPDPTGWTVSFESGEPVDATEVRQFATYGSPIALYAATGSWMDQGTPKGVAKVIRLDAPDGAWVQEADFGDGTTGGIATLHWTKNEHYAPVDVWTLVASIWSGANVFAKNLVDGKWVKTTLDPNGQIRAFATHDDTAANEFWGFAAGKPGIFRGQLADVRPAGTSPITWTTGVSKVELNTAQLSLPLCSGGGRVTGFAEARGRLFASVCWRIFERVDGPIGTCKGPSEVQQGAACNPRWKRVWDDPLAAQGESGLRGLTQVMHNGQQVLLVGSESGNMHITRIDPDTWQSTVEINISTYLNNLWGLNSGYGIIPYNAPMALWYGPDGIGRRLMGFEVWLPGAPKPGMIRKLVNESQLMNGEAFFFVRNSATQYQLVHIPLITAQPPTAVRDIIASPFKADCNAQGQDCAIFAGFFDANKSTHQTPCAVAPCTIPPLARVPTHGTGAIVKGRITAPVASAVEAAPAVIDRGAAREGEQGD